MGETNNSVPMESLSTSDCRGLADVLASAGDKWTIMVVGARSKGSLRYNEIQRRVSGISQRMLTLTLKRLEAEGLVTRTLFPSVPPRVDYELTALGQTLGGALVPLHRWAAENKDRIVSKRHRTEPSVPVEPKSPSSGTLRRRQATARQYRTDGGISDAQGPWFKPVTSRTIDIRSRSCAPGHSVVAVRKRVRPDQAPER